MGAILYELSNVTLNGLSHVRTTESVIHCTCVNFNPRRRKCKNLVVVCCFDLGGRGIRLPTNFIYLLLSRAEPRYERRDFNVKVAFARFRPGNSLRNPYMTGSTYTILLGNRSF